MQVISIIQEIIRFVLNPLKGRDVNWLHVAIQV